MRHHPTVRWRRRPPRGLTAVELLVATTLAAMLLVGILGVLTTLHTHSRELMQDARTQPWSQLLADGLRRDLSNARQMTVAHNRLVLTGYLGTRAAGHGTLRAAEVTYQVVSVGDYLCLVRDERPLGEVSNLLPTRQLVATGITHFQCVLPGGAHADDRFTGALPASCRVRFYDDSSTHPAADVVWCP